MAAAVSRSNLLGVFSIVKAIIQASGVATLNSKFASSSSSNHFYEYDPVVTSLKSVGYPYIVIETDLHDESVTFKEIRRYEFGVRISIRVQYEARGSSSEPYSQDTINSYAHEIIEYINSNRYSIYQDYNLHVDTIDSIYSDIFMIHNEKISERVITFNCSTEMDVVA